MPKTSNFLELYSKDRQRSLFNRFFFFCFNLFFCLDEKASKVALFDRWIGQKGISQACTKFLKVLKIDSEQRGYKRLKQDKAYLIFGNHPILIDPFAILSALKCDKVKLFAGENSLKIGPNFSRYVLPVKNMQIIENRRRKIKFTDWVYCLFFKSLVEYRQREKVVAHNQNQSKRAADFLAKGGKFLIFPFGQEKMFKPNRFRKGIGYILAGAMNARPCKEIIILPFFTDIPHPNIFSFKVLFRFRKKNLKIKTFFGSPTSASKYKNLASNPKKLAVQLASDYVDFARGLKKQ